MGTPKGTYTVNPDGSINAFSLEDALKASAAILERQAHVPPKRIHRQRPASLNGNSIAKEFIQILKPHSGKTMDSEALAKIIGAESAVGVGPKVRHMKSAFEQEKLSLSDYLEGEKVGRNPRVWRVK